MRARVKYAMQATSWSRYLQCTLRMTMGVEARPMGPSFVRPSFTTAWRMDLLTCAFFQDSCVKNPIDRNYMHAELYTYA